jgi:hypothetical protein
VDLGQLLQHIHLLKDKHYREPNFNLFTTLRGSSDEVRLHSRFLAALLDPMSEHTKQGEFFKSFVEELEINDFDVEAAPKVRVEYENIDILITNNSKQTIIIENKIYACDQHEQLSRYYKTMLGEGYTDITLIYLTLDGSEPDKQSIQAIPYSYLNSSNYKCISYLNLKERWLNKCLAKAALNPSLRESIAQYIELIGQLTGTEQSDEYMNELVDLLKKGNNILAVHDIQEAYIKILIELQWNLWVQIDKEIKKTIPNISEPNSESIKLAACPDEINRYYKQQKNNKWYGLYYSFSNEYPGATLGLEIDRGIFVGIRCNKDDYPDTYEALRNKLSGVGKSTQWWPSLKYIGDSLKSPSPQELKRLLSEEYRKQFAKDCAKELLKMTDALQN